jgi:hypothetical protein
LLLLVLLPQGASAHTVPTAEDPALAVGHKLHHSQEVEADPWLDWCLDIFDWYLLEADGVLQPVGLEVA